MSLEQSRRCAHALVGHAQIAVGTDVKAVTLAWNAIAAKHPALAGLVISADASKVRTACPPAHGTRRGAALDTQVSPPFSAAAVVLWFRLLLRASKVTRGGEPQRWR